MSAWLKSEFVDRAGGRWRVEPCDPDCVAVTYTSASGKYASQLHVPEDAIGDLVFSLMTAKSSKKRRSHETEQQENPLPKPSAAKRSDGTR